MGLAGGGHAKALGTVGRLGSVLRTMTLCKLTAFAALTRRRS